MGSSSSNDKLVVHFVDKTVSNLHYSSYKLGGKRFDPNRGVYVLDCSSFVAHVLQEASPNAYISLVNATGADAPASQHYYDFFKELSSDSDSYWSKVSNVGDLRAGDILVFRYKNRHGIQTGGHVMVVMNKPIQDDDVYLVRVADSAPSRHSEDTRSSRSSGVGIGTLVLQANSRTGQPSAYAWGLDSYWNKNVNIAMARPKDVG
jgi:cell wall-associated NlpC family hydrolase